MHICHYTTIETLTLILKYKTIRFNRLDRVDDMEEASLGYGQLYSKLGSYQFVSCWSKDLEENISLWKMYSNFKGVRISLDEDMFVSYQVNGNFNSYFSDPFKVENDCFITYVNNGIKLYDVTYVPDLEAKLKTLAKHSKTEDGNVQLSYKDEDIGIYKRAHWVFQKESRFKIVVQPYDENTSSKTSFDQLFDTIGSIGTSILSNKPITKEYFDIPLNEKALDTMRIVLGPSSSEAERIIVKALVKEYAQGKNIKIDDSYFKGKIKIANK